MAKAVHRAAAGMVDETLLKDVEEVTMEEEETAMEKIPLRGNQMKYR